MGYYTYTLFGLERRLPLTNISASKKIANFNILGDVELTEKAGEAFVALLQEKGINPECFVSVDTKIVPFVHHMAKRYNQSRYVVLRKNIRGYMTSPKVRQPWNTAPKHVRKLVLNGEDEQYLKGKKVVIVDDVVSTGTTMEMAKNLIKSVGAIILTPCALFKQGDVYKGDLIYLTSLPIFEG